MNQINYKHLITQSFDFPQKDFKIIENELYYNDISLMDIVKHYNTPLKIFYLPKISEKIEMAKRMFNVAIAKAGYNGKYFYCYCTKSSHFSFIIEEVLKNGSHLETSSAYDMYIVKNLYKKGLIKKDTYIIANGFKTKLYKELISELINEGFYNLIPVLDNTNEIYFYNKKIKCEFQLAIRIAAEEEPNFEFYTSRLGIRYSDIVNFYKENIANNKKVKLKMLHFFINTGIKDTEYYWAELYKVLNVYKNLKLLCSTLDSLNIGGGLPVKNSLNFDFDFEYMIEEIVYQIKLFCEENNLDDPHLFTEFGNFTVGESGINIYKIIGSKKQNDRELWYMIDNSFITTLPDTWSINQRFILLPLNKWNKPYQPVNIGGLSCDSLDYYNSEAHSNKIFLPVIKENDKTPLYIGFFNTGAYQESLSGFGGIKHCLIPSPKIIIVNKNSNGEISMKLFSKEQSYKSMLKILGY